MGLARNLERRLERFADGLSATVFRGRMHPVDLANRLVRQADLMLADGAAGPGIPNRFSVAVSERDLDPELDIGLLESELARTLSETAIDRGWRMGGPIVVDLTIDNSIGKGSITCTGSSSPAPMTPWGAVAEHRGERLFDLADNRVLIGRSDDVDIKLDEAEVSRNHAVIFRQGGRVWVLDLGSSNGTAVNSAVVSAEPLEIGSGDMLSFGPATFALKVG